MELTRNFPGKYLIYFLNKYLTDKSPRQSSRHRRSLSIVCQPHGYPELWAATNSEEHNEGETGPLLPCTDS